MCAKTRPKRIGFTNNMRTLQHYTSRGGLEGITRSKSLWVTDVLDVNDKTELVYGYVEMSMRALCPAWSELVEHLPPEAESKPFHYEGARKKIYETYRAMVDGTTGAEHLYVTSFARPHNEDQQSRGILTLWDRYTGNSGYCLEFDSEEVRVLLCREGSPRNYTVLELREVRYGIGERDGEHPEIHFQLKQRSCA